MCLLLEPEIGPDQHRVGGRVFPQGNIADTEALRESFIQSVPQFPHLNKEERDGCHLDGLCAMHLGVPSLALTVCLPFPHWHPLAACSSPSTAPQVSGLPPGLQPAQALSLSAEAQLLLTPPWYLAWGLAHSLLCSNCLLLMDAMSGSLGSEALAPEWV